MTPESTLAKPATPATPKRTLLMLLAAIAIGAISAAGATLFLWLVEEGQQLVYVKLPAMLGLGEASWWWAGIALFAAAGIILLARRMPGETGKGPLTGFHFDVSLRHAPSVILAAFASLIGGIALGPEAPLIVVGTSIGAILARGRSKETKAAFMVFGGTAAIGAVFGSPFIAAFMLLEFMAFGAMPVALLVPVLVALASSYLVQIGLWNIPGLGVHPLAVEGLPAYPAIQAGDLLAAVVVALVAGLVAVTARHGGKLVNRIGERHSSLTPLGAAALATLVLLVADLLSINQEQILFSGSAAMADLVAETSIGVALFVLLAKWLVFSSALGSGFRGGPIFPAAFLGVTVGVIAHLLVPGVSVSALAAAGIAASAAAFMKLPATGALLGAILITGTGPAIAPFAIFGAVIGFVVRLVFDRRETSPAQTG